MNEFFVTSMECTNDDGGVDTSMKNGRREVSKYLSRLQKCRDLIETSKQIVHELTTTTLAHKSAFARRSDSSSELREAEIKLNQYELEIDQQIDLFETSLANNDRLDADMDGLSRRLTELARILAENDQTESAEPIDSIARLDEKIEDVREELGQIEAMRAEIGRVSAEKSCLLEVGGDASRNNLSQSRVQARLLEGFNETVLDLEAKKDKELTSRLGRMSNELNAMREKCEQKLNELINKR